MVPVFILLEERDLTQTITEECVPENGDDRFAGGGFGVLETNKNVRGALGSRGGWEAAQSRSQPGFSWVCLLGGFQSRLTLNNKSQWLIWKACELASRGSLGFS